MPFEINRWKRVETETETGTGGRRSRSRNGRSRPRPAAVSSRLHQQKSRDMDIQERTEFLIFPQLFSTCQQRWIPDRDRSGVVCVLIMITTTTTTTTTTTSPRTIAGPHR
jgi:hypothetical protein